MQLNRIGLTLGLITTFLLSFNLNTQAQNTGIYVTFEGGPAFPLGSYRASESASAGYAQLGINGTAAVGFRLNNYLALGGKFAFTQNPVAPEATFLEETPWRSNFFMADLTLNYPFDDRFALEGNLSGGYAQTEFPDGDFEIGNFNIYNEGGKGSGFGYGAGLGLRYFLDDYVSFKLGANYLAANQELNSNGNTVNQSVNLLTTNFGVTLTMD